VEPMRFGIVTQIRNESKRLEEWINFHKKIGFERFIFFDDKSDDKTREILEKISGVSVRDTTNEGRLFNTVDPNSYSGAIDLPMRQIVSFQKGIEQLREESIDWVACIDVDEFMIPLNFNNMHDAMSNLDDRISRIYVSSFDMDHNFTIDKPVLSQTTSRWSEETRVFGRCEGHDGLYKTRGKSMVNVNKWNRRVSCVHTMDGGDFLLSGSDLSKFPDLKAELENSTKMIGYDMRFRIFHFRVNGKLQKYDEKDDRALVILNS
jgi:hypothetical protein